MLATRSFFARPALRAVACRALSTQEVPITQVARVIRLKVDGEESALKVDAAIHDAIEKLRQVPGSVKVTRQLCKTEWGSSSVFFEKKKKKVQMRCQHVRPLMVQNTRAVHCNCDFDFQMF